MDGIIDTIEDYIAQAPEERRETLQKVRKTIHEAAPDCVEKIAYRIPTFWQGENLIHFAAFKNHMGLYPTANGVAAFAERLAAESYKCSKGTIQIPWDRPMPYELIAEITRHRVRQTLEKTGSRKKG